MVCLLLRLEHAGAAIASTAAGQPSQLTTTTASAPSHGSAAMGTATTSKPAEYRQQQPPSKWLRVVYPVVRSDSSCRQIRFVCLRKIFLSAAVAIVESL